jgi:hypothetical protein
MLLRMWQFAARYDIHVPTYTPHLPLLHSSDRTPIDSSLGILNTKPRAKWFLYRFLIIMLQANVKLFLCLNTNNSACIRGVEKICSHSNLHTKEKWLPNWGRFGPWAHSVQDSVGSTTGVKSATTKLRFLTGAVLLLVPTTMRSALRSTQPLSKINRWIFFYQYIGRSVKPINFIYYRS